MRYTLEGKAKTDFEKYVSDNIQKGDVFNVFHDEDSKLTLLVSWLQLNNVYIDLYEERSKNQYAFKVYYTYPDLIKRTESHESEWFHSEGDVKRNAIEKAIEFYNKYYENNI